MKAKGVKIYFVIDGFDVISSYLQSSLRDPDFPKAYELIVQNGDVERIILMVSNEEYGDITKLLPDYQFEPSEKLPENMMRQFIRFILGGTYDLDNSVIVKIHEVTGDNLRQIGWISAFHNKRRDFLSSEEDINKIKVKLRKLAQSDIQKIFEL